MLTYMGSKLHGTQTPSSDTDFKGIFIPDWKDILKPRIIDVIDEGTGNTKEKNTAEDIDKQYYALHKFFDMLAVGDMNAYEMVFAPNLLDTNHRVWEEIVYKRDRLLSRECKGSIAYSRRQASLYGNKATRLAEVTSLVDFLKELDPKAKLGDYSYLIKQFVNGMNAEHTEIIPINVNATKWINHLSCCNRKIPYSAQVSFAIETYQKIIDEYGNRAKASMTNEGVEWKSLYHAVRIGEQTIELLETGKMTFPRPNVPELMKIKTGNAEVLQVREYIDELLEKAEALQEKSSLPEKADRQLMNDMVQDYYYTAVTNRM